MDKKEKDSNIIFIDNEQDSKGRIIM